MNYNCKRCGICFSERKGLMKHLRRKNVCIGIESTKTQEELLEELNKKEGVECEECKRIYKNEESLRRHKCKGVVDNIKDELRVEIEKKIRELQKELKGVITKDTIKQVANSITNNNDNSTTNNNNTTNNINNTQNITVIINDIDDPKCIQYILKDPKLAEKILRWVTDKNGLLKYMDEKYYNPKRPENQCIRRVDNENMELYILGTWIKHDNMTALNKIINILGIDWSTIIAILKYDYSDDYESNKKELVVFKREVGDPLDMDVEITDDEDETKEKTKQMVCVDGNYELVDVKDEVLVKKEKKWKEKILKNVK
jgi:hypothetical protein